MHLEDMINKEPEVKLKQAGTICICLPMTRHKISNSMVKVAALLCLPSPMAIEAKETTANTVSPDLRQTEGMPDRTGKEVHLYVEAISSFTEHS